MILSLIKYDDYYEIKRKTGLLNGKLVDQPVITIKVGKAKRTLEEQATLEAKSILNSQKDKGYKLDIDLLRDLDPSTFPENHLMDYAFIDSILPIGKTYDNGFRKLMLAKDPKPIKNFNWGRDWLVSRKLDGIRAAVSLDIEGNLQCISRNGKALVAPLTKIFKSTKWKSLFKKLGDDVIIDGELYIHGRTLQYLSGAARLETYDSFRHDELEFWIFDYANEVDTAEERCTKLNSLQDHFDEDDKVKIVNHIKLNNHESIKKIHDIWVKEGYEGAICRQADQLYGFGKRDDRMVKMKEFQDAEFVITGMKEGLRPEDMVFTCMTDDGKSFDCKPIGPREVKYQYIEDIDNIIGKKLTVKFFNLTSDGIPFLPTGSAIRDYE